LKRIKGLLTFSYSGLAQQFLPNACMGSPRIREALILSCSFYLLNQGLNMVKFTFNNVLNALSMALFCLLSTNAIGQHSHGGGHHHRAKIFYNSYEDLQQLADMAIEIDHGSHKRGVFIESDFSDREIQLAKEAGFQTVVEIPDIKSFYLNRSKSQNQVSKSLNNSCSETESYEQPENFELGSMAGFFTYDEILAELDAMAAQYPDLITTKAPISDFQTFEERPIYWLRMSDNANVDEDEPEMMYSAIHHAREPASVSQLIFYMWYLLENYDSDLEVQAILNNTQLYFVPVLNPDGYVHNVETDPNGGGLWRKNRRDHGDGTFGVDNNRNYGIEWGTTGISFDTESNVYCGTEPFSEAENQAMKWFTENHNFKIAFNNHTFGNLLLYPFGWEVNIPTPEDDIFQAISGEMVSQNGFANSLSAELYPASGDSDDWMYTATPEKDRIFAFTPEIGNTGFWPAQADIIPICQSTMYMNLTAAHMITNYAKVEDALPGVVEDLSGTIPYALQRLGLDAGDFTVTIEALSDNISFTGSQDFIGLELLENGAGNIAYTLDESIQDGDIIQYRYSIDNGQYISLSPIEEKVFGQQVTVLENDASDLDAYTNASDWELTTEDFVSAPSSITDSPNSEYNNNEITYIELASPLNLIDAEGATLSFMAKWDIEAGWDYAQCEISPDGGSSWIPQCGQYTVPGNDNQDEGQPLYDGTQNQWVQETISLSDYLGSDEVLIRFKLVSDNFVTEDGFYFDDIEVGIIGTVGVSELDLTGAFLSSSVPNPTSTSTRIAYSLPEGVSTGEIVLRNYLGQHIRSFQLRANKGQVEWDASEYPAGTYFYTLSLDGQAVDTKQLVVFK